MQKFTNCSWLSVSHFLMYLLVPMFCRIQNSKICWRKALYKKGAVGILQRRWRKPRTLFGIHGQSLWCEFRNATLRAWWRLLLFFRYMEYLFHLVISTVLLWILVFEYFSCFDVDVAQVSSMTLAPRLLVHWTSNLDFSCEHIKGS